MSSPWNFDCTTRHKAQVFRQLIRLSPYSHFNSLPENGEHGEKLKLELSSVTRLCGSFLMVRVLPKETQFKWSSSPVLTRKVWCQICCYEISRGNYADIACLPCFVHRELKAQESLKRHCDNKTVFWTSALRLGQSKHLVASYIHKLVSRFWCSW